MRQAGQEKCDIKVGVESKGHKLYDGLCNQGNKQNLFGRMEYCRILI